MQTKLPSAQDNIEEVTRTPESDLWNAVLYIFVKDVVKERQALVRSTNGHCAYHRSRLEAMIDLAKTEWIEDVCSYANQAHSKLVATIIRIAEGEQVVELPYRIRETNDADAF